MNYLMAGLGFLATGAIAQLFSTGYPSEESAVGSAPIFAIGGGLILVPFVHSAVHTFGKTP